MCNRSLPLLVTCLRNTRVVLVLMLALALSGGLLASSAAAQYGTVWAWGDNDNGQLGDGSTTDRSTPVQVTGPGGTGFMMDVMAMAGGSYHTVAVKADGTVWAWGRNWYGQLGDGSTVDRSTPVQVKGPGGTGFMTDVVAVAAGSHHTVAVKSDGTVWAWGANWYGRLGDGSTANRSTPVQVRGPGGTGFITDVVAVATGSNHTVTVKSDGTVWAWGANWYGQLGDGSTVDRSTPVQVKGLGGNGYMTDVVAMAGGSDYTVAVKADGTVWAWGRNWYGQLGDGSTVDRSTPVQVKGPGGNGFMTDVVAMAGGSVHTVALKSDGTVWAWGSNYYGQLGDGSTTRRSTPVQVTGSGGTFFTMDVVAVAAGSYHTAAVTADGTAWAWGRNREGQLGDGSTISRITPVQVKDVGGVGNLDGIAAINCGNYHTMALKGSLGICSPARLNQVLLQGQSAASQTFQVTSPVNYTISIDVPWISAITPSSGLSSGEGNSHTISYATDGLSQGTYNGTITVSATDSGESLQTIPVTLAITLPAEIPDDNLRQGVADALGVQPGDITLWDMKRLASLELDSRGISSIHGLQQATNLQRLSLHNNQISDISSLAGLTNLWHLNLDNNQISDISSLAGLANLDYLDLDNNRISDISSLAGLTNLWDLYLCNNQISDVSSLAELTNLHFLSLYNNQISDISSLAGLTSLWNLDLDNNQISDVSSLAGLTNLQDLFLDNNQISDISSLAGLTSLWSLDLSNNQISDVSSLAGLTSLWKLDLSNNQISDISSLAGLTSLRWNLDLSNNQISDISPLAALTNLEYLELNNNQISDVSALATLTNLWNLDLSNNQISDISSLAGLTNLWYLHLDYNHVSNITSLAGLTNLRWLVLRNNLISDISSLAGLTQLEGLSLRNNQISDISSLAALTNLQYLFLKVNQISDISPLAGLTQLEDLTLCNNQISDISSLAALTNLVDLEIWKNQISDISPLAGLTNLVHIDIGLNRISDISSLAGLTNLVYLFLDENRISDIASLGGLTDLEYLGLEENQISDISSLAGLTKLQFLLLDEVNLADTEDLSALYGLNVLRELSLAKATHLDGSKLLPLLDELPALVRLDVSGLWHTFDAATRDALTAWGAIEGRELIISNPDAIAYIVSDHAGNSIAVEVDDGYIESRNLPGLVLKIYFTEPVNPATVVPGVVSLSGKVGGDFSALIAGVSLEDEGFTLVVNLSAALPNRDWFTFTLSDAVLTEYGTPMGGSLTIGMLRGDVNQDGVVCNADVLATRSRVGEALDAASARYDLDCSGDITGADMMTVRRHMGTRLP